MWDEGYGGWGMHGSTGWVGWIFLVLMLVFVVVAVVVLVMALLRVGAGDGTAPTQQRDPIGDADRILKERFARGEIDEEEYRRRSTAIHAG